MTNEIVNPQFRAHPDASASIHDDGIVILHAGQGRLYRSNRAGASIWRAVEQRLPLEAIADRVSGEHQIPRAVAREHAVHFLGELERRALIQRRAA